MLNAGSAAISSRRLLSPPSSFTLLPACIERTRMRSCSSWRLPPFFTASIMMFSVAMNGSSAIRCFVMTLS